MKNANEKKDEIEIELEEIVLNIEILIRIQLRNVEILQYKPVQQSNVEKINKGI